MIRHGIDRRRAAHRAMRWIKRRYKLRGYYEKCGGKSKRGGKRGK